MLCNLANRQNDDVTQSWIISAIIKVTAQLGKAVPEAVEVMEKCGSAKDVNLQQRALEFSQLLRNPVLMSACLPVDASAEDIEIDEDLTFLDDYVQTALDQGAREYNPPADNVDTFGVIDADPFAGSEVGLKIDAYDTPTMPSEDTNYYDDENDDENDDSFKGDHNFSLNDDNSGFGGGLGGGGGPWGSSGYKDGKSRSGGSGYDNTSSNNNTDNNSNSFSGGGGSEVISGVGEAVRDDEEDENSYGYNNGDVDEDKEDEEDVEIPEEPDERASLANALFAGVGSGGGVSAKTSARKAARAARRAAKKKERERHQKVEKNGDSGGGGDNDGDLLGGLGDLMGSSNSNSGGGGNENGGLDDVFGLGDFGGGGGGSSSSSGADLSLDVPDSLRGKAYVGNFTRTENKSFGECGGLVLSGFNVMRQDGALLVLFLQGDGPAKFQIDVPRDLKVVLSSDSLSVSLNEGHGMVEGNACVLIHMTGRAPSGIVRSSLSVTVNGDGTELPMGIRVWLRPLKMDQKNFGAKWGQLAKTKGMSERKVKFAVGSVEEYVTKAKSTGLFPVSAIAKTGEVICATFIGGSRLFLLSHCRVSSSGSGLITVRGPAALVPSFAEMINTDF
eukprot:g4748.t1